MQRGDVETEKLTRVNSIFQHRLFRLSKKVGRLSISIGLIPIFLTFLFIVVGSLESRFLTVNNLINVARQSVYLTIVSMGGMLPVLCAGLDLSVGSSIALTSVVSAMMAVKFGTVVGISSGIIIATLIGAFNGIVISIFRIPPFIVTLAMLSIARGIALIVSKGTPVLGLPKSFLYLNLGSIGPIPLPVIVAVLIIIIMYTLLSWTRVGRYFYALGGNEEAAKVAGIPIKKYIFLAYVFCGILTGIAAVLLTARVTTGEPTLGSEMALQSIAAIVLGGTSLFGGEGNIISVVFGAIFITFLSNAMNLLSISSYVQLVAMGSLLALAVIIDKFRYRNSQ